MSLDSKCLALIFLAVFAPVAPVTAQSMVALGPFLLPLSAADWHIKTTPDQLSATRVLGDGAGLTLDVDLLQGGPALVETRLQRAWARISELGGVETPFEVFDWEPAGLRCRYHQGIAETLDQSAVRSVGAVCEVPGSDLVLDGVLTYRGPLAVEEYRDTNLDFEALFEGITRVNG